MSEAPPGDAPADGGAAAWIGRTIEDRYRIERLLGEGGMGAVFVAEHVRLAKHVAVKVILSEHAGNDELARRFAREAMVTAKLEHPHVVSALDAGSLPDGGAYLVMQLAPGRGLADLVVQRPGVWLACEVGAQIADALAAAHEIGVVHRDIKPANVVVEEREDGSVHARVLDFGIARAAHAISASETPLTRLGAVLGTPGYMPPEQALGEAVDHRADLYSLGVLVWEIATGRPLFPRRDLREITVAQLTEPVPLLDLPGAPPELQALLDVLLEPKREARPASAVEVRETLRRCARSSFAGAPASPVVASLGASIESASRPPTGAASEVATARTELALAKPRVSVAARTPAPPDTRTGARLRGQASAPPVRLLLERALASAQARRIAAGVALAAALLLCVLLGRACSGEERAPVVASAGDAPSTAPALPGPLDVVPGALAGAADTDVPSELQHHVRALVESPDEGSRRIAAAAVVIARARVPAFAAHLADYELAQDCEERRDALRALRADRDPRAIPPLRRLRDLPRSGCGPEGRDDCHRCVRRDVDRALERLLEDEREDDDDGRRDRDEREERRGRGRGRGHEKRR